MLYCPQWEPDTFTDWRKAIWDASNLIQTKGWTQREYMEHKGFCIMGALEYLRIVGQVPDDVIERAERELDEALDITEAWNDENGRTKQQVVAKLREVALRV